VANVQGSKCVLFKAKLNLKQLKATHQQIGAHAMSMHVNLPPLENEYDNTIMGTTAKLYIMQGPFSIHIYWVKLAYMMM